MIQLSSKVRLRVPADTLWSFLSDTDRVNRAVGLPFIRFTPDPDPSRKGHYRAEASLWGLNLSYEEFPFEWVQGRYYRILRRFKKGPIAEISGGIRLRPEDSVTELEVFADVAPRNLLGSLLARTFLKKLATQDVITLALSFESHFLNPESTPPPGLPPGELMHPEQLRSRFRKLEEFPVKKAPAEKLKSHLLSASDLDVIGMRPFELADRWGEDRREVLRLMLFASKAELLDLTWNVLCPHCRAPSAREETLFKMKPESRCDTCEMNFGTDLADSVEVRFSVNPAVRLARSRTYCIGGPANKPQILAQIRLEPGEKRKEALSLKSGRLRVHCFQAGDLLHLDVSEKGPAKTFKLLCRSEEELLLQGENLQAGTVEMEAANELKQEALITIEKEGWKEYAATAALVTSLQEFRDIFPGETVAPGREIGISCLAVLFTDLRSSTALYQKIGDPLAFNLVQSHFRFLVDSVSRHYGGVVKTMGDAIMASFARAADALEAAVEMQKNWKDFLKTQGNHPELCLKIGIHQGPSIAINNKGLLDYFGTTVNLAARVQDQSQGGDVVFTEALNQDAEVASFLKALNCPLETKKARLRGIEEEQILYQIWPAGKGL